MGLATFMTQSVVCLYTGGIQAEVRKHEAPTDNGDTTHNMIWMPPFGDKVRSFACNMRQLNCDRQDHCFEVQKTYIDVEQPKFQIVGNINNFYPFITGISFYVW